MSVNQYNTDGTTYIPAGDPPPPGPRALSPGVYDIQYSPRQGVYFNKKNVTTDNLVDVPDTKASKVLADIRTFWTRHDLFKKHGYAHKRGILMHGPPGSGKTSTLATLAKQLVAQGGVVFYANDVGAGTVSAALRLFRQIQPNTPCIMVFEDIDEIFTDDGEGDDDYLPLLDGDNCIDRVVFIATTNHLDKLPPRLRARPSRFDQVVYIGMPSAPARRAYLESRNLDITPEQLNACVEATEGFAIAHLKELVVAWYLLDNDFNETVERMRSMLSHVAEYKDPDAPETKAATTKALQTMRLSGTGGVLFGIDRVTI